MGGIRLVARVRGSEIEQSPSNSAPMAYRRKMGDTITLKLEQWSILTLLYQVDWAVQPLSHW